MRPDKKKPLGKVDVAVSALGLGTVAISNLFRSVTEAEAEEVINTAWDAGVNFFDTAPLYGHGLGELRLGHALRHRKRDDFILASKVGRLLRPRPRETIDFGAWVDVTPFELAYDYSYDGTMRAFEDSLQRLALERMDVCFIHDIDVFTRGSEQPEVFKQAMDGCFKALAHLRDEGAVKAIGVGVNEWQVCQEAMRQRDFDCFLLAGRYSLLEQGALESFLPRCAERGASVVIGGGFNSGILATGAVEGARYNYGPAPPEIMDRVRAIETVCREYGVPLQAAAMQFVAAHPAIASLVVGARSAQQLKQSIGWFDTRIPAELWSKLKSRGFLRDDAPIPSV